MVARLSVKLSIGTSIRGIDMIRGIILIVLLTATTCYAENAVDQVWLDSPLFAYCQEMEGQPIEGPDGVFDCDDFALAYHNFHKDTFLLAVWFNADESAGHAMSLRVLDGKCWVVEPQTGRMITSETIRGSAIHLVSVFLPQCTVFSIEIFSWEDVL